MTPGDEGREVQIQQTPAIGGAEYRGSIGIPPTAPVVASEHLTNSGNRAEGVMYPEAFGAGPEGNGYPAGTAMTDNTPGESVN